VKNVVESTGIQMDILTKVTKLKDAMCASASAFVADSLAGINDNSGGEMEMFGELISSLVESGDESSGDTEEQDDGKTSHKKTKAAPAPSVVHPPPKQSNLFGEISNVYPARVRFFRFLFFSSKQQVGGHCIGSSFGRTI
jgi:hypothetical protein